MNDVKINPISPEYMPSKQNPTDAGYDLRSAVDASILTKDIVVIPCGFSMEIPEGYEAQIRPRSGLAAKFGVTIVNTPGTVDAGYRGEVKVILINLGRNMYTLNKGDRIAQMVFNKVESPSLVISSELSNMSAEKVVLEAQARRGFTCAWQL